MAFDKLEITARYLVNSDELQIKIVQGTKLREGGRLMGFKVDKIIATTRHTIS